VKWASEYEFTDAGHIRDKHRNVLPIGAAPDYAVSLRMYDTARTKTFPQRDVLAMEYFGAPYPYRCVICDKPLNHTVVHLNGNPQDFSRDNLKRLLAFESSWHKFKCIRWAMESNLVPPRIHTHGSDDHPLRRVGVNSMPKRGWAEVAHLRFEDRDWGPTDEDIPLLGINPEKAEAAKKDYQ
jgi:hypothetical protein